MAFRKQAFGNQFSDVWSTSRGGSVLPPGALRQASTNAVVRQASTNAIVRQA